MARVGFVMANEGVEQIELTSPLEAAQTKGYEVEIIAPETGDVQCYNHLDKGETMQATCTTKEACEKEYDLLIYPGGVANPDQLRMDEAAVELTRKNIEKGTPVAVICHGPWTLVEAGCVEGRTLTSWPSLKTDIENAGGTWVDEQVFVCTSGAGALITSRKPDDLDAFNSAWISEISQSEAYPSESRQTTSV